MQYRYSRNMLDDEDSKHSKVICLFHRILFILCILIYCHLSDLLSLKKGEVVDEDEEETG